MAQQCPRWLLWAGLFSCVIGGGLAQHPGNNCAMAGSCSDCLQAGPNCAWCKDPTFGTPEGLVFARCNEAEALERLGCSPEETENPQGSLVLLKPKGNPPAGASTVAERLQGEGPTRLRPQEVLLKLRVGEPLTVPLRLQVAEDYPIDLYYLMGLSGTLKEPWEEARSLVTSLQTMLRNITSDVWIGLGIFGGAAEVPASATAADRWKPCPRGQDCPSPLSYRHVLSLTPNETLLQDLLGQLGVSGNEDAPGSGSSAVMQVAACHSQIGWRRAATRLLVVSTNVRLHAAAGDGEHAGHALLNSRGCLLDGSGSLCTCDVPPSIAHLTHLLSEKNIQTIFAVTPDVRPAYEELQSLIPKSTVETLSSDASNITQVILDAYRSLSSEVVLETTNQPTGVTVEYQSLCGRNGEGDVGEEGRECTNVSAEGEITFEVKVTANQCPEKEPSGSMQIRPRGFVEELEIHLTVICGCPCQSEGISHSPQCHGSLFECGACRCSPGQYGRHCECDVGERSRQGLEASCQAPNSSEVCSNNGECVCGQCICQKRENPEEQYSGKFCECNNFNCGRSNGLPCGGHGRCVCGECECWPSYTGSACECPLFTDLCEAPNGQICHGRGTCECGLCKCNAPYRGLFCEVYPVLLDVSAEDN